MQYQELESNTCSKFTTEINLNIKRITIKLLMRDVFLMFLVCSRKFSGASFLYLGTKIVELGGRD